jgi:hypothetical protein
MAEFWNPHGRSSSSSVDRCAVGGRRANDGGPGSRSLWWCRIGCAAPSSPRAWRILGRSVAAPPADHAWPPAAANGQATGCARSFGHPQELGRGLRDQRPVGPVGLDPAPRDRRRRARRRRSVDLSAGRRDPRNAGWCLREAAPAHPELVKQFCDEWAPPDSGFDSAVIVLDRERGTAALYAYVAIPVAVTRTDRLLRPRRGNSEQNLRHSDQPAGRAAPHRPLFS